MLSSPSLHGLYGESFDAAESIMPLSTNFYDAVTHLLLGPPNHLNNGPRTLSITLAAATTDCRASSCQPRRTSPERS